MTIEELYRDVWSNMQATYLTLMTQIPGTDEYLISETIIWESRALLNKMLPEVEGKIWFAKKLEWDCICHTKREHLDGLKELGTLKNVEETYGICVLDE